MHLVAVAIALATVHPPNVDLPTFRAMLQDRPDVLYRRLKEVLEGPVEHAFWGSVQTVLYGSAAMLNAQGCPAGIDGPSGFTSLLCARTVYREVTH